MTGRDDRCDVAAWGTTGGSYSLDRTYRWSFERTIGDEPSTICWIGLFPTKTDTQGGHRQSLARMCKASRELGMGHLVLMNLFSLRCNGIADLERTADHNIDRAVGDETTDRLVAAIRQSTIAVAAWGNGGRLHNRSKAFLEHLPVDLQGRLHCLGVTASGEPCQPGRLPDPLTPMPFR